MRLWTEYEGETIDGTFPLKQLLLPEGRSAFFSTANAKGDPALLRLIECHFDEDEILARWRTVEALNHPHFLRLERYGQIQLDGNPAVYAIFEKADANLGDVLAQGHLGPKETLDLAFCLVAALEMLHNHGFVHEHLTPQNIFAVGDVVKLRSDCIRDAPEGQAGRDAKQRDVRDLATVLLQTLTQRTSLDGLPASALPPPFDGIVRNGMTGTWGLAEIRTALGNRPTPPAAKVVAKSPAAPPREPVVQAAPKREDVPTASKTASAQPQQVRPAKSRSDSGLPSGIHQVLLPRGNDKRFSWLHEWMLHMPHSRWLGVAGLVVVVTLLATFATHELRNHSQSTAPAAATASAKPAAPTIRVVHPEPRTQPRNNFAQVTVPAPHRDRASRTEWRVIAYTYNHPDQARKKAASLALKHPNLNPQVFTPTGHAPYLVAVGGVMNRDQAVALAHSLRGRGMPRDTYAQNY